MKLNGRTAIVTGAASGIGLATARRLLLEGACVMLVGRNQERLDAAMADLEQVAAGRVINIVCDVACEEMVAAAVDATIMNFGSWDIVVNSAGFMSLKPIELQTRDDWRNTLDVDLLGAFYFLKQAFLKMRCGGVIVNVSSVHAMETEPLVAPYAAAKAALLSLTRSGAIEGRVKGIRVNAVLPGAVDTPMLWNNPNVKSGVEEIDRAEVGRPEDVASSIAFLVSDDATFINGAMLNVDGGRLARL